MVMIAPYAVYDSDIYMLSKRYLYQLLSCGKLIQIKIKLAREEPE